jgi:hypothetical protein
MELLVATPHRQHHFVSLSSVQKLHRQDQPWRAPDLRVISFRDRPPLEPGKSVGSYSPIQVSGIVGLPRLLWGTDTLLF